MNTLHPRSGRRLKFTIATIVGVFAPFAPSQVSETVSHGVDGNATIPAFQVASIRLSDPKQTLIGIFTYPGGRVEVCRYTVKILIQEAYDLQPFQISGGPNWMMEDVYDIIAIPEAFSLSSKSMPVSPKSPLNQEQRQMLQSFLVDRFKLTFRRAAKDHPVYLLMASGKDPRLRESADKEEYPWVGGIEGGAITHGTGIAGRNASMQLLAKRLSTYFGRPILDETTLNGSFDFRFSNPNGDDSNIQESIVASLEGLGLKLKAATRPVETIVVEHLERPSPN